LGLKNTPIGELLGGFKVVVWNRDHANQLYSTGFYGRPIGDPRPRKGVDPPLVLDLIEAYYLAQRRALRVLQGGRELTAPEVAEAARGFQGFQEKSRVYKELRDKGYVVTPGLKYGCDFAVYEHGPGIDHAPYLVDVAKPGTPLTATQILRTGRLATTVRKAFVLAVVDQGVDFVEFNWWRP